MRIGPLGIWELLIILVVVLLIFGPRRLPEMAKGIGQSVREFRKGIRDMKDDFEAGSKDDQPTKKQSSSVHEKAEERPAAATTAAAASKNDADDETSADKNADKKPLEGRQVESNSA
jgi:sec-independent protein translocase protein TatA